ncbi:crossover junction endodeoxyribonuclease RuvC [Dehalobacterium formicoaceticum]|uniref:Crossover junction endodeoxyribonuclease RuvC n=1 Tax=Dehalobacterium formicoaceticum TaxID=51515 RepID=A0ABT1Y7F0_9FIRM|nr:crossover junction endodeoxyribonuclease RuvC [Dehalobacterium formicoaceticum]MCR6546810.1 crossover junction endodeoxyribonuclease RuvC [Dehalobacterium formicoaceticum]
MIILGIDPGTAITGYGVIETWGNKFKLLDYGCIRTDAGMFLEHRLEKIYQGVTALINLYHPQEAAIEELFFNKNARTALAVGHARGVIYLAAVHKNVVINEYTPLQVKQAVVGYGRADKHQVQYMIKTILKMPALPKPDDAADALAIAICHAHSRIIDKNINEKR